MPSLYRAVSLLSFLLSICLSQAAAGADLPRMEGDLTPACRQALEIAREAFRSSDANLLNAHPPQPHVPVKLVLALSQMPSDTDDFVDEEWMGFDSQSDYGYTGIYYWKMSPDKVAPLIRISQIGNGTVFQTRLVSLEAEAATPDQQFERALDEITDYFPPRIYMNTLNRSWWLLSGNWSGTFSSWTVNMARGKAFWRSCEIHFLPKKFKLMQSLPSDARTLAKLLSQTLGSGKNDGTMQQTARQRRLANESWTNLLLRPWADLRPYNSRKTVDRELARWARRGDDNSRLHREILSRLPKAEMAVAKLYQKTFGMSADVATQRAATNVDRVYRSYFVFPKSAAEVQQLAE